MKERKDKIKQKTRGTRKENAILPRIQEKNTRSQISRKENTGYKKRKLEIMNYKERKRETTEKRTQDYMKGKRYYKLQGKET
jgi:hypothetical protein